MPITCGVPDGTTTVTLPLLLLDGCELGEAEAGRATAGALAVLPATTPRLRFWDWSQAAPDGGRGRARGQPAPSAMTAASRGRLWREVGRSQVVLSAAGRGGAPSAVSVGELRRRASGRDGGTTSGGSTLRRARSSRMIWLVLSGSRSRCARRVASCARSTSIARVERHPGAGVAHGIVVVEPERRCASAR